MSQIKFANAIERRYKIYQVSECDVLDLFGRPPPKMMHWPVFDVPDGCLVLNVSHDPLSKTFAFLLHHPDWPVIPEGTLPPQLGMAHQLKTYWREDPPANEPKPITWREFT